MKNKQVKAGVFLSYLLIVLNALYGIFVTPFIVSHLGDASYGVYKTISSLTSSLMVLDLGIGGTALRYISKYLAQKQENKIPNFVAMLLIQAGILSFAITVICFFVSFFIGPMYSDTLSSTQIELAEELFLILSITMVLHIFENVINGAIRGYNQFIFANSIKIVRLISKVILTIIGLTFIPSPVLLVIIDLILTALIIVFELLYLHLKLNLKIKFSKWENAVFKEAGIYTILMFIKSIAAQVNNNLDNVVIGAFVGPIQVTIYSIGLLLFTMFENISTSVSGVMLPTVTNVLAQEDGLIKVQRVIIKAGRFQFSLLGAALLGFIVLGKDFLNIWMGNGYDDAYIVALMLMIPSLLVLCINVCNSVLSAKNKLAFRTVVLLCTTIFNAIITIFLVKNWSYLGAAVGTAIGFTVGSFLIMNIYYYKTFKFNMIKIYLSIFSGIGPSILVAGAVIFFSSHFLFGNWLSFILNVFIFLFVYSLCLLTFGLSKEEKNGLPIIKKFFNTGNAI